MTRANHYRYDPCFLVKGDRPDHGRQGIQSDFAIPDPPRLSDDGVNQRPTETKAAPKRRDVEPLHLTAAVGWQRSKPDASQWLSMDIAREQQFTGRWGK